MKLCERALNWIQIIDYKGTVRGCSWMRNNRIGSLSCQNIKEIYHGKHADELRAKLIERDYSLCNMDACPYLAMNDMENHMIEIDEIPEYPEELYLAFEQVCNYHCTSCTVPEIMKNNKMRDLESGYDIIEKQLEEALPHVKKISANGCGELFVSKRILKLLANWKPLAPIEQLSVSLETNGSLFDEEHWKQIENLGKYHLSVSITVMSFDEPTYQLLSGTRLPISKIEDNLRFVKSLREKGIVNYLEIATVVQERNFRYLPEFTRRCIEEFGADYVRLRPYMPWGAREPEIEWFTDIRNPNHPYYNEYKEIMKNEIFKHPLVHDWSGGLDTVNIKAFPYKEYRFSFFVEQILTDIILNIDVIIERLRKIIGEKHIVIYGLGNIGKVLLKLLIERGFAPDYVLDKYVTYNKYCNISVYNLTQTESLTKEIFVLVTPLRRVEEIKSDLGKLGYGEKVLFIQDILENKILAQNVFDLIEKEKE